MNKFTLINKSTKTSVLTKFSFVLLTLLFSGVSAAWAGTWYAKINASADPSNGGYVFVGTSSSCSANNATSSTHSAENSASKSFKTSGDVNLWLCAKAKSGYTFKGWNTDQSNTVLSGSTAVPFKVTVHGSAKVLGIGGESYDYYAIFARMAANTPAAGSTTSFDDTNVGSESGWKQIKINHAHAGTVTISQSGNDGDFFVGATTGATTELSSFSSTTETTRTLYVKFVPQNNGLRTCTLTVSSNNGLSSLTYYLKGNGYNVPSITWVDGDGNELTSGETTLSAGDVLRATCTTGQTISYSDFNSSYFTAGTDGNGNPILTVREDISGTVNGLSVTANLTKNTSTFYAAYSEAFTLNVTNLTPQTIEWTDDITDISDEEIGHTITLSAVAKNAKTGANSGQAITYSMAANDYLSLSGNVLTVKAIGGPVAITATAAGNENYAPTSVTKYATVIDMSHPCATSDSYNSKTLDKDNKSLVIYPTLPGKLTFNVVRSSSWFVLNKFTVKEYSSNNSLLATTEYNNSDISTSGETKTINCNVNTTKIELYCDAYLSYSCTVSNVSTTRRTESSVTQGSNAVTALSYATDPGQSLGKQVTVTYSNIPVFLSFKSDEDAGEKGTSLWSLSTTKFGGCGKKGSQSVTVTFMSNAKGNYTDKLYVRNNVGDLLHTIDLSASVTAQEQFLNTWNIADEYNTTDQVTLQAATKIGHTDFTFTPETTNPANIVTITNAGVMTFSGSGTATIRAYQPGDPVSLEFVATHDITINKSTPNIKTAPTGTSIKYLQTLNKSTLSGGAADITLRGVAHTAVYGSFAWTEPTHVIMDNAGSHSYSVTFTPTNGDMYTTKEFTIPITILRAEQALAMNNGTVKVAVDGIDAGAADSKIDLDGLINSQTGDVVNNVKRDGAITYEVISANKATATIGEGNIFSATVCGTYTIRATKAQTDWYNVVTDEFTVTVEKRANTLATTAAYTRYVDDVIATVATSVNSNGTIHTSTSDGTIAYYDVAQNKIFIPNSEAKSFNSTTVTIKIWQDATDRFEGITEANAKTITLTIKKYDNWFTCSWGSFSKTVNFDEVVPVELTTQNTDYTHSSIAITQSSGEKIATLVRNDNTNNTITAFQFAGDATWHLSQPENYKYKAAEADLSLSVRVIDGEICYMFEDNSEHEFRTKITDGSGHFDDPIAVSGPVNKLYFEAKRDILAVSKFIVQYSVDNGSNWRTFEQQPDLSIFYEEFGPYEFTGLQANEHVSHIRFGASVGGTLSKYYKNIKISRTTNIQPLDANGNHITTLTMPQSTVDGSTTAQFYLNYSSCDDVIKIVSDNGHFTVDQSEISVDHSKDFNSATITVTYHSSEKGTHTGTITIYTKYQNETLTVTGTTDRKHQTLTWEDGFKANPLSLQVGLVVDNVNYAATVSSEHAVYYESSDESVIEITDGGLGFKIVGEGTATLKAKDDGDDDWFPVSDTKTINATYKQIQEIVWTQDFIRNMELGMEKPLEAQACIRNLKTGELNYNAARTALITYSCPANSVISLDNVNKKFTIIGYGQTSITASLPTGAENYEDAHPVTLIVKVRKPSEGCEDIPWVLDQSQMVSLYEDKILTGGAFNFSDWTTPELTSAPILLDPANGKPDKLSYQHNAEIYTVRQGGLLKMCSGEVIAQQRVNGTWYDIEGSYYKKNASLTAWDAGAYDWREVNNLQLDENADAIRFKRYTGGMGHHNFKDIQINLKHYLRPTVETVELGDITIGEDRPVNIGIEYSNIQKDLRADEGNEIDLFVDEPNIRVDCDTFGHYDVLVTIHPMELGLWSNSVIVTDKATNEQITIVINANVIPEFIHTYETAGQWGEQTHWKDDKKPSTKDEVRIAADVEIVSDIAVKGITIEQGVTVTVNPGVTLTLTSGTTRPRTTYGNLHVKDGGKLVVGTGVFMINDFILDAALGNADNAASSGQVLDDNEVKKFVVKGDAYFDLALDPSGECSPGWYDFTVPFEVDALKGITRFDNTTGEEKVIKNEVNYAIMDYSESRRLETGYGWKKFRGIMQPGKCYTITIDDVDNVYRFKKAKDGAFYNQDSETLAYTDTDDANRGWNGLGNGTLAHVDLNADGFNLESNQKPKVQIYSHAHNSFTAVEIDKFTCVVGSAFLIQAPTSTSVVTYSAGTSEALHTPRRNATMQTNTEFKLSLVDEQTSKRADRLYVGASEDALDSYEIGRDLAKCGTPTDAKVAQVWVKAYGMQLCDIDMPLVAKNANCSLAFFAPQEGLYTFTVERGQDDAQLFLTKDDRAIWNLSVSPYTLELSKGTTEGYGLRIVANHRTPTDIENGTSLNSENGIRKVLIDDKIYVITPSGAMYDILGKGVKY